jgi:DNA-binding transcriptional regulator YdaS (Cro superfamily)
LRNFFYRGLIVASKGYIMNLQEYFLSQPRGAKTAMAYALNISKTWLSLIVSGKELPSPALAVAISAYTKNKVSRKTLRADIFG